MIENIITQKDLQLVQAFLDGLRPIERLTVSEWADQRRKLSSTISAWPGQWQTKRVPYLKAIMDKLSALDPCREIVVMKGAQLGLTEAGCNWVGYTIDNNPTSMLMIMPTIDTMERNSKMRIQPMIDDTPVLAAKVLGARKKNAGGSTSNTLLQKDYPGGTLIMTGANSAAGLRSIPCRYIYFDEVDAYPKDLEGEGDPIAIAEARARTFADSKFYKISTPTIKGHSAIEKEFDETDKQYYFVPCPHCDHKQTLVWEQMRWEEGKPETAHYECLECKGAIYNYHKAVMLPKGEWLATVPEKSSKYKIGFHINSLYSPVGWYSWEDAVKQYDRALKNGPEEMVTFLNTVLGLSYEANSEVPDWELLYARRENYSIGTLPAGVCFVTAGADVQKDRIELEIVGWGKNRESWSIDYRVLWGQTDDMAVWDELAKLVTETWAREDGAMLPLAQLFVDSGYNSSFAYDFCRRFDKSRVMPIRGNDRQTTMLSRPRGVDYSMKGKKIGRIEILNIGVGIVKSEVYGFLRSRINMETGEVPFGYCHFPQYDTEHFKGLVSEKLVELKDKRGKSSFEWKKNYKRNEPLDCRVYARAAAERLGYSLMDDKTLEALSKQYAKMALTMEEGPQAAKPNQRPAAKKRRDDFW